MDLGMGLTDLAAATLCVVLGSVIQVVSGVGGGFLVVPLLAWLDLDLVPAPLIFASLSLSTLMAVREWDAIDWDHIPSILIGLIPGSIVGAYILSSVPANRLGVVFGTVLLFAILITMSGIELRRTRINTLVAGALSGGMGTSSGIGAPLLALLYQKDAGPRVRATLAALYTGASILILMTLFGFDKFSITDARSGALLIPGFLLGYWVGNHFTVHVDRGGTRVAILGVSAAAAIALIVRSFS
jgi:uncharacterized membrane protein YfcA